MSTPDSFDLTLAHRYLSVQCFNRTWELLDKADRSVEENEQMINAAHASLWHWMQRPDCTPQNLSIGYWQISRVYAMLGQADNARRYGQLCLGCNAHVAPFFQAYAHEALARAEFITNDRANMELSLAEARRLAEAVPNEDDRAALLNDLKSIG